jgi:hypothetical protein
MVRSIIHPSKEQVRAYMAERELARRPPPAPAEIRRRLGWQLAPSDGALSSMPIYLLAPVCSELVAQVAIDWFFAPLRRVIKYYGPH